MWFVSSHLHGILWQFAFAALSTSLLYGFLFFKKQKPRQKLYCIFAALILVFLHFIVQKNHAWSYFFVYLGAVWLCVGVAAKCFFLVMDAKRRWDRHRLKKLGIFQNSNGMVTSFGLKMRSKSEILIAEKLHEQKIKFEYEKPLSAEGKTFYPDFTIYTKDKVIYWEHFGLLHDRSYHKRFKIKLKWYEKNFPDTLVWTKEDPNLVSDIVKLIETIQK